MKKYIIAILLLSAAGQALSQNNIVVGQYFKVMPMFAPALTGATNFLDIKAGSRNQWLGYDGAPQTNFFSANGALRILNRNPNRDNSMWVSDMSPYEDQQVKIGLGGYVIDDRFGAVRQFEGALSSAVHLAVNRDLRVSLGISGGINNVRIDVSNLTVSNENDLTYLNYVGNGYQKKASRLALGVAAYSDHYYFSYAMMNLYPSGSEQPSGTTDKLTAHHIVGGYSFSLDPKFELIPNVHIRKVEQLDYILDAGVRVRYIKNAYAGLSFRTSQSFICLLGYTVNDLLDIGYSYEASGPNAGLTGSHEVVVGIRLFNYGKYVPLW